MRTFYIDLLCEKIIKNEKGEKSELIPLGRRGENEVTKIIIDFTKWKNEFGEGIIRLLNRRNGDDVSYPIILSVEENIAIWIVKNTDVANPGAGECELQYVVGDKIVKSRIYTTATVRSLEGEGEAPDPWESWLDQILAAAERAETAAEAAEEASERYPYIRDTDKHWMVWDVATGEYKDTGVVAEGGGGGGGTPTWTGILNKPFERLGDTLKVEDGTLDINIYETTNPQGGSTLVIGQ